MIQYKFTNGSCSYFYLVKLCNIVISFFFSSTVAHPSELPPSPHQWEWRYPHPSLQLWNALVYSRHSRPMVGVLLFHPSGVWPTTSYKNLV